MGIMQLINAGKKRFTIIDVASDEIAILALALLIAKYWVAATSLAWYWYVLVMIVFWIKPMMAMLKK